MRSDGERPASALSAEEFDEKWAVLQDFISYNPGARHRRRLLLRLIHASNSPDKVLDAGCGLGELVGLLHEALPRAALTGVDFSEVALESTRRRFPFATFETLDLERDRLARTFDLVVNSEVLEHINDQDAAIANIAAMVAPGGTLVLSVPAGRVFATEREFGHVRHPDREWLTEAMEKAGLQVIDVFCWGFPVYLALKYAVNARPDYAMREFGSGSYGLFKRGLNHALYAANFVNRRNSPRGCETFVRAVRPRDDSASQREQRR